MRLRLFIQRSPLFAGLQIVRHCRSGYTATDKRGHNAAMVAGGDAMPRAASILEFKIYRHFTKFVNYPNFAACACAFSRAIFARSTACAAFNLAACAFSGCAAIYFSRRSAFARSSAAIHSAFSARAPSNCAASLSANLPPISSATLAAAHIAAHLRRNMRPYCRALFFAVAAFTLSVAVANLPPLVTIAAQSCAILPSSCAAVVASSPRAIITEKPLYTAPPFLYAAFFTLAAFMYTFTCVFIFCHPSCFALRTSPSDAHIIQNILFWKKIIFTLKNGKIPPKNGGKLPMVGVEGAFSVPISISLHLRSPSIFPSVIQSTPHFLLHHHHSSFRRHTRARRGIGALRKVWTIKHMFQTRNAIQAIRALFEILRCFWGENNPPF